MMIRPIIFSAPMVQALRDGRKTQTRRLASSPLAKCEPGDVLYVRESYALDVAYDKIKPTEAPPEAAIWYAAGGALGGGVIGKQRPGIHMPRWASRLTLLVRSVSIERLWSISEGDAQAEGALHIDSAEPGGWTHDPEDDWLFVSAKASFRHLWDRLHTSSGERWQDNPEVVALTFEVIAQNVDHPNLKLELLEG